MKEFEWDEEEIAEDEEKEACCDGECYCHGDEDCDCDGECHCHDDDEDCDCDGECHCHGDEDCDCDGECHCHDDEDCDCNGECHCHDEIGVDCSDCDGCRCEDCEEDDCAGCECEECDGCEKPSTAMLVIDAREGVTLHSLLGALADVGALNEDMAVDVAEKFSTDVGLTIYDDVVMGCKGLSVELSEGESMSDDEFNATLDALTEGHEDGDNYAGSLLDQTYSAIIDACAEEQGGEAKDLGSFARTDILYGLALASEALSSVVATVAVTQVELGFGSAVDNGIAVSKPTSLAMSMLSAAEIAVSITKGAQGVDTPTAALLSAVSEVQLDEVEGTIGAKGIGIDGGVITRIYLLDV